MPYNLKKFKEVSSTNGLMKEYLDAGSLEDNTVFMTESQTAGRGQGDNKWQSEPFKNILASVYKKLHLPVEHHYLLNMSIAVSICKYLEELNVKALIKWPNDIYINNNKLAGLLVENRMLGKNITSTIIGIGLNVNQVSFPKELPNPVSLQIVLNKELNLNSVCEGLFNNVIDADIFTGKTDAIYSEYIKRLYRKESYAMYVDRENGEFEGRIVAVTEQGQLIVEDKKSHEKRSYFHGDIEYVL